MGLRCKCGNEIDKEHNFKTVHRGEEVCHDCLAFGLRERQRLVKEKWPKRRGHENARKNISPGPH